MEKNLNLPEINKEYLDVGEYLNSDNFTEVTNYLTDVLKQGLKFKIRDSVYKKSDYLSLYETLSEPVPEQGISLEELLVFVQHNIIDNSTNFSSPYSMAFPDSGNAVSALAGSILSDCLNQNLINWSPCAPSATVVEVVVIEWLRQLIGFEINTCRSRKPVDAGGMITSGGVASNTIALMLAREKFFPDSMLTGIKEPDKLAVIVPDGIDHYSSRLSAGWLGIGEEQVIKSPTKQFKYDLNALLDNLQSLSKEGKRPFFIVAYAGDSRTMTCDDFKALREIADAYGAWLHIDACQGGQLLFCPELRSRVDGIEYADSVTLDPHKVLTLPYALSALIVRSPTDIQRISRPEDIITGEAHSFGQITPLFGSRPFSSLKLYMLIKNLGREGIADLIQKRLKLAKDFAQLVLQDNDLVLVNPDVHVNSVAFMYYPQQYREFIKTSDNQIELFNRVNTKIQSALFDSGKTWLHNFEIPDLHNVIGLGIKTRLRPLRFMSGNPNTTSAHIQDAIRYVKDVGAEILLKELE